MSSLHDWPLPLITDQRSVFVSESDSDSDACTVHLLVTELRSLYVYFEINLIYASIHRRIRGSLAQQTVMAIPPRTQIHTHAHTQVDIRKASLTVLASLKTLLLFWFRSIISVHVWVVLVRNPSLIAFVYCQIRWNTYLHKVCLCWHFFLLSVHG